MRKRIMEILIERNLGLWKSMLYLLQVVWRYCSVNLLQSEYKEVTSL
jgi:hypothetical protein